MAGLLVVAFANFPLLVLYLLDLEERIYLCCCCTNSFVQIFGILTLVASTNCDYLS